MSVNNPINSIEPGNHSKVESLVIPSRFSFFRQPVTNTFPQREVSVLEVYELVKGDSYRIETETLRAMLNKEEANVYKKNHFPYVTFSGTFTSRRAEAIIQHSGLLAIDFDHVTGIDELKRALLNDRFFMTHLLFVSPSGDGIKWIVSIDTVKASHLDWFLSIANYIRFTYNMEVDANCKDVCRACFLCHDAEAYIHPNYLNSLQPFNSNSHENN